MNKTVSKFLEEQAAVIALKMDEIGKSETPDLADYHFLTALMMSIQYLIETNGKASKKN